MIEPSVGRIVWFRPGVHELQLASDQPLPAIVTSLVRPEPQCRRTARDRPARAQAFDGGEAGSAGGQERQGFGRREAEGCKGQFALSDG